MKRAKHHIQKLKKLSVVKARLLPAVSADMDRLACILGQEYDIMERIYAIHGFPRKKDKAWAT